MITPLSPRDDPYEAKRSLNSGAQPVADIVDLRLNVTTQLRRTKFVVNAPPFWVWGRPKTKGLRDFSLSPRR